MCCSDVVSLVVLKARHNLPSRLVQSLQPASAGMSIMLADVTLSSGPATIDSYTPACPQHMQSHNHHVYHENPSSHELSTRPERLQQKATTRIEPSTRLGSLSTNYALFHVYPCPSTSTPLVLGFWTRTRAPPRTNVAGTMLISDLGVKGRLFMFLLSKAGGF
jgi:hypothetical protein